MSFCETILEEQALKAKLQQSSLLGSRKNFLLDSRHSLLGSISQTVLKLVAGTTLLVSWQAQATSVLSAYDLLKQKGDAIAIENKKSGLAYLVSGSLALSISIPAFYLSEDVFARAVYGISQTLGVASIGYGSYLLLTDNDYTRFNHVLEGVHGLSSSERNQVAELFLRGNAQQAKSGRMIRVITHALTASLSFVNGMTSSQAELQTGFFFLAGINTLIAFSYGFGQSEEEKLAGSIQSTELILGPIVGVKFHF